MKQIFQNSNNGRILVLSASIAAIMVIGGVAYFSAVKEARDDKESSICSNEFVHKALKENNDPLPLLKKLVKNCGDEFYFYDKYPDRINFGIKSGHLFDDTKIHLIALTLKDGASVSLRTYLKNQDDLEKILSEELKSTPTTLNSYKIELRDLNGDQNNDLLVPNGTGASGQNHSYDIWLYKPKNNFLHKYTGPELVNPGFDKEKSILKSCGGQGCAGMCYQCDFYRWNEHDVILIGRENRIIDESQNLVNEIYELSDNKLSLINENDLLLIRQTFKNRIISITEEELYHYELGHYVDEANGKNYYIKSLNDLNGDGLEEFALVEVDNNLKKTFSFYTKDGNKLQFLGKEIGSAANSLDAKEIWSDLTVQDITGDGKKELIIRFMVTGNSAQVHRILTFDDGELVNILFEDFFSKELEISVDFDSISREDLFVITLWHNITARGKSYYTVNGNTAFFEKSTGLYTDDMNSDQYEYREIDKNGNIIYKEKREGNIWTDGLSR